MPLPVRGHAPPLRKVEDWLCQPPRRGRDALHWHCGREAICSISASCPHGFMARKAKYDWGKSRSGRYQKFETRLTFNVNHTHSAQESVYIDTAQFLSLINRKLVRQGHVFKIKNFRAWSDDAQADTTDYSVAVLPRTWMMFNAYKKARSLWNQMNLEAVDALGSGNLPKYYDFKTFFDMEHFDNHHNTDGGDLTTNLFPCDSDGNAMTAGEWVYSKFESSASTPLEWNCHMLGTHATASGVAEGAAGRDLPEDQGSVGLILAYQQSRGAAFTDQDLAGLDQNVDIDSPWAQLFAGDTQMQEVLTDLDVDNDGPPYPADYSGGILQPEGVLIGVGFVGGGDGGANTNGRSMGAFEAPLGLLKLDLNRSPSSGDDVGNIWITMDTEIVGSC